jgi:hypothetical protein
MHEGTQTDRSDEHITKADSPRLQNFEPDSNAKLERLSQPLKQDLIIASSDEGIQIDSRDEHPSKADSPINQI